MKDSFQFFLNNIFSVLLITLYIVLLIKAMMGGLLKELIAFISLALAYIVAWNFHTYKGFIFEDLYFTQKTSQLLVFIVFFCFVYIPCILAGFFLTNSIDGRRKLKFLPVALVLSTGSALIWGEVVFFIVDSYFIMLKDDLQASLLADFLLATNNVLTEMLKNYFSFLA